MSILWCRYIFAAFETLKQHETFMTYYASIQYLKQSSKHFIDFQVNTTGIKVNNVAYDQNENL